MWKQQSEQKKGDKQKRSAINDTWWYYHFFFLHRHLLIYQFDIHTKQFVVSEIIIITNMTYIDGISSANSECVFTHCRQCKSHLLTITEVNCEPVTSYQLTKFCGNQDCQERTVSLSKEARRREYLKRSVLLW